jgi:hypothetical protein
MGGLGNLSGDINGLMQAIEQLISILWPLLHPTQVVGQMLNDSAGTVLRLWSRLVLSTKDFDTAGDFTSNATVTTFEPPMQAIADAALVLAAIWACYRIMWSHGLRSQFTARVLFPRLVMGAILINFAMPMFQAVVGVSNTISDAVYRFGSIPTDWSGWVRSLSVTPNEGLLPVVTTAVLVLGYDVLVIAYLVRYTILIFLAISAPLAGLLFVLPDTIHLAKTWRKLFITNLLMQPVQLFVMSIGFALENAGHTPMRHVFALASLLVVFKVPGAMGSADKIAHKLESTMHTGLSHVEHAVVRAA